MCGVCCAILKLRGNATFCCRFLIKIHINSICVYVRQFGTFIDWMNLPFYCWNSGDIVAHILIVLHFCLTHNFVCKREKKETHIKTVDSGCSRENIQQIQFSSQSNRKKKKSPNDSFDCIWCQVCDDCYFFILNLFLRINHCDVVTACHWTQRLHMPLPESEEGKLPYDCTKDWEKVQQREMHFCIPYGATATAYRYTQVKMPSHLISCAMMLLHAQQHGDRILHWESKSEWHYPYVQHWLVME